MDKKLKKYFDKIFERTYTKDDEIYEILEEVYLAGAHAQAEADQEAVENECGDFGTPDKGFDLCYRKAIRALGVAEIKEAK